jgi:integrase
MAGSKAKARAKLEADVPDKGKSKTAKLGERVIDQLAPGETVLDTEVKGLGIRRQDKGRFFFVRKFAHGRRHFESIGEYGQPWTIKTARERASTIIQAMKAGYSPAARRSHENAIPTVGELADLFMALHTTAKRKPNTVAGHESNIRLHIKPTIGHLRADRITTAEIASCHHGLKDTPYLGNRVLAVLSKMFAWAEKQGYRDKGTNPCDGIEKYSEDRRERFLDRGEMERLGVAIADAERDETASSFALAAIRLLILTGARRNEILELRWEYVDLERGLLMLPDSKTGRKAIFLNAQAVAILAALPRLPDNPHVIVGEVIGQHLVNIQKPWDRIRSAAGLDDVRIHDLRHSFASAGHRCT